MGMMRVVIIAAIATLSGCATQKTVYLPDGRPGHSINCSGSALSWDLCYQKAGELCQANGYDILAKEGEQGSTISGTQYGIFGGTTMNRTLLIACKGESSTTQRNTAPKRKPGNPVFN